MSIDTLIRKALDAGVELALVDGVIKVIGHRAKVKEWRNELRTHKAAIYRRLTAASDPEPPADPADWRELAAAYHAHHFKCPFCIAAGKGYGLRCGVGAALWSTYSNTVKY